MGINFKIKILTLLFCFFKINSCPTHLGKKLLIMNKITMADIHKLNYNALDFKTTAGTNK